MERVNRILSHPLYREALDQIQRAEKKRRYCHHDMAHFLDVARIAAILAAEEGVKIEREMLYAAALVHDIGRGRQYEDETPHERAGAELACRILPECGFDDKETSVIISAVLGHRSGQDASEGGKKGGEMTAGGCGETAGQGGAARILGRILARADKLSRPCYSCKARAGCKWSDEKKNLEISI